MNDFHKEILEGIPDDLPAIQDWDPALSHAPVRKDLLTKEQITKLGDGRIYTAQQALDSGLIDHIEYLDDTIIRMKNNLDIENARIITYYRAGEYPSTIYSSSSSDNSTILGMLGGQASGFSPFSGVEFLYLWRP